METLTCSCGRTETFPASTDYEKPHAAHLAGWMLGRNNKPLCPVCAGKRDKRSRAALVRRVGVSAVVRAERDIANLRG